MALFFNGHKIENVKWNGIQLEVLKYNGKIIWENWKLVTKRIVVVPSYTQDHNAAPFTSIGQKLPKPVRIEQIEVECSDSEGAGGEYVTQSMKLYGHYNGQKTLLFTNEKVRLKKNVPYLVDLRNNEDKSVLEKTFDQFSITMQGRSDLIVYIKGATLVRYFEKGGK